jgi:ATP-dependent RNA helicase HelY
MGWWPFDVRSPALRRHLVSALRAKLDREQYEPRRGPSEAADAEAMAVIGGLRRELASHPCHSCPDRETHARAAEAALKLERETETLQRQADRRTNTIAVRFDRVCSVLESMGYLTEGGREVTAAGRMLTRIYSELDLVTAEAIRSGVLGGLSAPQLAAVLSSLVFEARGDRRVSRMPDRASERAQSALRGIWRVVSLAERDHRLGSHVEPDIGFAEAVFGWTAGNPLGEVLETCGLTAGDFVRWARQVVDVAGQVADASEGDLRKTCREVVQCVRRGVVDVAPLED